MQGLADLFEAMTNGLRDDRQNLNQLDDYANGDTGDNMVYNFETITSALRQMEGKPVTVDQALNHASQVLREQGRGGTAPIYATGLQQAAQNLKGKESFGLDDLIGLLGGLMSGAANAQQPQAQPQAGQAPGIGGLLAGLVPGVTTFMQSRKAGESTIESLFKGFMAAQRGAYGTTGSNTGYGQGSGSDTSGRVDPGAAGASSILGGLLGSLLSGGLSAGRGQPSQSPGLDQLLGGGGLGQLFGGAGGLGQLFGGGQQPQQPQQPQQSGSIGGWGDDTSASEPRARLDDPTAA